MRKPLLLLVLVLVASACGSGGSTHGVAGDSHSSLTLVAYSTPKPVLAKLIAGFDKTSAGRGVSFTQSYGPSGSQARAIAAGQPADVAFLSTGLDIDTLASAGVVSKNWESAPYGGDAADSVVAFAVRPGNPKHIHDWSDLTRPGVKVVTPNPFSSGSAKWNVLAAYGAARKEGMSDKQAIGFVQKLFQNVVAQDSSGSDAMQTFLSGEGDVLLTYESEAYAARDAGQHLGIVIPRQTMLIQLPMVALDGAPQQAKQFIAYAHTTKAQTLFAENGYRPVVAGVLQKPSLAAWKRRYSAGSGAFKITDPLFGGWTAANKTWFDQDTGRMIAIERATGGPTAGS
jgi:sulfate transport system substrate-binding protein